MNRILPTTTLGGHRDVLDNRDIHAGAVLELWHNARWLSVRYECRRSEAWLVLSDDTTLDLDRATMWLRWPGETRGYSGWTGDGEKD